jgi:hypothetical protein
MRIAEPHRLRSGWNIGQAQTPPMTEFIKGRSHCMYSDYSVR